MTTPGPTATPKPEGIEELQQEIAREILHRRGFGFYKDPMDGGQDAYDITLDALAEADAILALPKIAALTVSAARIEEMTRELDEAVRTARVFKKERDCAAEMNATYRASRDHETDRADAAERQLAEAGV